MRGAGEGSPRCYFGLGCDKWMWNALSGAALIGKVKGERSGGLQGKWIDLARREVEPGKCCIEKRLGSCCMDV